MALLVAPARFWGIEVYGGGWAPQTQTFGGASATFTLGYVGAALCPLHIENSRRVIFDVCAGGELGILTTSGGLAGVGQQTNTSFDAVAEGSVSFPIAGPVRLHIGARLGLALRRDRATYTDSEGPQVVFEGGLATAVWDVGIAALFR